MVVHCTATKLSYLDQQKTITRYYLPVFEISHEKAKIYWAREEKYIIHDISMTRQTSFGYFTVDTSFQHTDYRESYIFVVNRLDHCTA